MTTADQDIAVLSSTATQISELAARITDLAERYGVRRSSPKFWQTSDWFARRYLESEPVAGALFDLNRYDDL